MANNDRWPPHYVAGAVGSILALGWALPKIFAALDKMIGSILHALGEMIVLVAQASTVAVPTATWTVKVASIGVAAGGVGTVILVLVKAAKEAAEKPYEWTVPLLGILGGLALDLAKEYGTNNPSLKALVTAVVAFLAVVAGSFWKKKNWLWRTVAVVFLLIPPVILLARGLKSSGAKNLVAEFHAVPASMWVQLGVWAAIGVTMAVVHALVERRGAYS